MHRFRCLDVWQVATPLSHASTRATLHPGFRGHFGLSDQVRRVAIAIPANLAEGYGLGTRAQLIRCTRMALGSAYELARHLELVGDLGLLPAQHFAHLTTLSTRCISLLIGLLRGLARTSPSGPKH